jgi:hypothetical protein
MIPSIGAQLPPVTKMSAVLEPPHGYRFISRTPDNTLFLLAPFPSNPGMVTSRVSGWYDHKLAPCFALASDGGKWPYSDLSRCPLLKRNCLKPVTLLAH